MADLVSLLDALDHLLRVDVYAVADGGNGARPDSGLTSLIGRDQIGIVLLNIVNRASGKAPVASMAYFTVIVPSFRARCRNLWRSVLMLTYGFLFLRAGIFFGGGVEEKSWPIINIHQV